MPVTGTSSATNGAALGLEAAYLHARSPADAKVVFFARRGAPEVESALAPLAPQPLCPLDFELLLPTDEATLAPLTPAQLQAGDTGGMRIAPAVWKIRGQYLALAEAVPVLAALAEGELEPSVRLLRGAARLVLDLLERGDFAPVQQRGMLRHAPCWTPDSIRCLNALGLCVPESLLTARFAAHDEPVYAVTPRNLVVSFVGHAVDALARKHSSRHQKADPLPREFWRTRPTPVLEVQKPERELEEGVPWGVQVLFRPIPGLDLELPLAALHEQQSNSLFPDALVTETLAELEHRIEEICKRVPALHRACNMADGRASLNRGELDQVLDHLPLLESEGCEVRLRGIDRMLRLSAQAQLTEKTSPGEARPWFEFQWALALGDQRLSRSEFEQLVQARSPLVQLRHGTVLLSPRDREAIAALRKAQEKTGTKLTLFEALRLKLGGAAHLHGLAEEQLDAGPKLDDLAARLDGARVLEPREQPPGFVGELRPYQKRGQAWMYYLIDQGFGACLADDMGLGKTVQAIAVILDWRQRPERRGPILLVCPVSVLGNWRRELQRFAPELRVAMHHGKGRVRNDIEFRRLLGENDVVLTSYNLLQRDEPILLATDYEGVVLDEAQNIKNPSTRQSKAARRLNGRFRLVLTGTPLENRPLDLWSIMDFLNEGLLGTKTSFLQTLEHPIVKQRSRSTASTLARLVRPFVLRRLKTDPDIISDLPEKSEQIVNAPLTREQAVLYEAVVRRGLNEIEHAADGMPRRGAILTTLLRLKQVCNHPAHYAGDGSALAGRSGKLDLLVEMVEEALEEGDRCLVFTQFKEMGTLVKTHFESVLATPVLFLHGGVPQKERESMVAEFQSGAEDGPRIFVLSLKAGGTGLNLTMANRVFHYDRWWNPAVEDQATDRAFRIGQNRNVFVHKFVCIGTLEERVQAMLERKREVASTLLGAGENWLTELSNEELRRLLILDRKETFA
jgi:hypothetical protein